MNLNSLAGHRFFAPALGAMLTSLCGLALWIMPAGQSWHLASYDYLFRFSARATTNQIALIQAEHAMFEDRSSSRRRHAQLLERLAADGCPLVALDILFEEASQSPESDQALAQALGKPKALVVARAMRADADSILEHSVAKLDPIYEPFLKAAAHWGIAGGEATQDVIQRRHWPFSHPDPALPSLAWKAAQLAGSSLAAPPTGGWIRYYGPSGAWERFSYDTALRAPPGYFSDKQVFIGSRPSSSAADIAEGDKYLTPYSRWTGEAVGGVEINATQFLNLMNRDWLRRPEGWVEAVLLLAAGAILGAGLGRFSPAVACAMACMVMVVVGLTAVSWSYFTNGWFPYLIVCGAQVPCALAWTLVGPVLLRRRIVASPVQIGTVVSPPPPAEPEDYERIGPPFGKGAFGKVWLARDATGTWLALKEIRHAKLETDSVKFKMEWHGITKYKPISHQHPGLLRVEFVSRVKQAGLFYYVMELGDSLVPGWEKDPKLYRPRDLKRLCHQYQSRRLPLAECLSVGAKLADALEFLHHKGLTHRDLKPSNIIFVNGQPKLADAGTVTVLRPPDQIKTMVGSLGYMPPAPEAPGTRQADLYSLGMILYVISSGRDPVYQFPEISTIWVQDPSHRLLRQIIRKACHPEPAARYLSATELKADLLHALEAARAQ